MTGQHLTYQPYLHQTENAKAIHLYKPVHVVNDETGCS